jgi:hypothetical protein
MPNRIPHDAVSWALFARSIKANYLRQEEEDGAESRSPLLRGLNEGIRIVTVGELMRDIELTLKWRVTRFLKLEWGDSWWSHIPGPVRRRARSRRKWSAEQLGQRRVVGKGTSRGFRWAMHFKFWAIFHLMTGRDA